MDPSLSPSFRHAAHWRKKEEEEVLLTFFNVTVENQNY